MRPDDWRGFLFRGPRQFSGGCRAAWNVGSHERHVALRQVGAVPGSGLAARRRRTLGVDPSPAEMVRNGLYSMLYKARHARS